MMDIGPAAAGLPALFLYGSDPEGTVRSRPRRRCHPAEQFAFGHVLNRRQTRTLIRNYSVPVFVTKFIPTKGPLKILGPRVQMIEFSFASLGPQLQFS